MLSSQARFLPTRRDIQITTLHYRRAGPAGKYHLFRIYFLTWSVGTVITYSRLECRMVFISDGKR